MKYRNNPALILWLMFMISVAGCAATETRRSAGQTIDDTVITSSVKTALLADKLTDGMDIEIEVFRGRLQLNGVADSAEEKQRAEEIALGVRGVVKVANNLEVNQARSAGEYVDDKILIARVNAALGRDALLSPFKIDVDANRGMVMLGGFVNDADQRRRAGDVARSVRGVQVLRNNLEVK